MSPKFSIKAAKFASLRKLGTSYIDTVVRYYPMYSVRKKYSLFSRVFLARATASSAAGKRKKYQLLWLVPLCPGWIVDALPCLWCASQSCETVFPQQRQMLFFFFFFFFFWSCLTSTKLNKRPCSSTWLEMALFLFFCFFSFVSFLSLIKRGGFMFLFGNLTFWSEGGTFSEGVISHIGQGHF